MPLLRTTGPLADVAPPGAEAAQSFVLDETPSPFAVERDCVAAAIERRRREYFTARRLGREVLTRAGADGSGPIGQGPSGEPCWPAGFTGSLTHCAGFVGAVAAPTTTYRSMGIDAEPSEPLPPGVLRTIASGTESAAVRALGEGHSSVPFDRLLFCIKEATYKVWFPLERSWLGFDDVEVELDARGRFVTHLHRRAHRSGIRRVHGTWTARSGLLVCAATAPPG
jgi:4'-phosphopantetheinyl transferase EntD